MPWPHPSFPAKGLGSVGSPFARVISCTLPCMRSCGVVYAFFMSTSFHFSWLTFDFNVASRDSPAHQPNGTFSPVYPTLFTAWNGKSQEGNCLNYFPPVLIALLVLGEACSAEP